ncbi:PLP-dependent aminotransferase family protein [Neptunomonas antarctica]|uniref:Transcriptional regulator, GntR family n=1 Tax=Neptunomonas antarctica TaxID=619304 RepID=A0A1N7K0R9_9GAMM|nr:PLP-dependent aminotransferase family protein [Neptunomonas antarctica]SIS55141.1 transcriptional regulator, GntR family [Neptunomonas antarctica]
MIQDSGLHFAIDRSRKTPIFEQLCEMIRKLAHTGVLKKGTALPATRVLAEELDVSRSTVVSAYEQLVAEGYLQGRRGSGYTVCAIGAVELPHTNITDDTSKAEKVASLRPLTPGQPDMRLFPYRHWAKTVARVCRTNPEAMMTGAGSFGNDSLRQAIANHVREWRGLECSPQQIIVTAGATDALNICFRTLVNTGQAVGIEDPGYKPILRFVSSQGLTPVFLDIDQDGAKLPEKKVSPHIVVLTPSHQYPLGGVMSLQRRWEYIRWANTNHAWIIEDDYDSELRYSGRPIPAMASFDNLNRTIYIGSFSKVFSNTLRLGYLIVPHCLIAPIRQTMDNYGLKAGLMPQQALSEFIDSGDFYRHLRRVRKIYNERRKFLVDELSKNFSHFGSVQNHPAGMQLVFHLNNTLQDSEIAQRAKEAGIALEPLSESTMRNLGYNGFILGFCGYSQDEMSDALDKLHTVFSMVKKVRSDA